MGSRVLSIGAASTTPYSECVTWHRAHSRIIVKMLKMNLVMMMAAMTMLARLSMSAGSCQASRKCCDGKDTDCSVQQGSLPSNSSVECLTVRCLPGLPGLSAAPHVGQEHPPGAGQ